VDFIIGRGKIQRFRKSATQLAIFNDISRTLESAYELRTRTIRRDASCSFLDHKIADQASLVASLWIVSEKAEEVSAALMNGSVSCLELVELPAENKVFEFPVITEGCTQKIARFEDDRPREGHEGSYSPAHTLQPPQ
jgi:hypothetical protein